MRWACVAAACWLPALAACRTFPVEFAEPAGARLRCADRAEVVLPATLPVGEIRRLALELEFDAATLAGYGMDAERASELVARGAALVHGQLIVLRGEGEAELRRFALPGALVVRAFDERETLRCWWPPENGDALFFEGAPAGATVQHPARSVQRSVISHTDAQRSSEFGAALSGALLGLAILLIVVSSSM